VSLAVLLGTWSGHGRGEYPTIESFAYDETVTFGHAGKPFVAYNQRTRRADDGRPLHAESGYFRVPDVGRIELALAHPTGIVEIDEGTFDGTTIKLASKFVGRTGSAKEVTMIGRDFVLADNVMEYSVRMAAVGQPLTHHLAARLERVE